MGFWNNVNSMELQDFRPGIRSRAEIGTQVVMACMEIGPGMEDAGHQHPFDQCGIVTEGRIEMFVNEERRILEPMDSYFIPAGSPHGWKTFDAAVKVVDICVKPS